MTVLSTIMAIGYALLGIDLVIHNDYMDAFVAFTVSAVFAFGLLDVFSGKKRRAAHTLTGGLLSMIFSTYFAIEYFSNGLESLISNGYWNFNETLDLISAIVLGIGGIISFYISKKVFKNAKIKTKR